MVFYPLEEVDDDYVEEELDLDDDDEGERFINEEMSDNDDGMNILRPASKVAIETLVCVTKRSGSGSEFYNIYQETILAYQSAKQLPCEHIYQGLHLNVVEEKE